MRKLQGIQGLLGTIIIGGTILSFGTSAFANTDTMVINQPNQIYSQVCHGKHHFNEMMTELVNKKIITQEQADKWAEFRQSKMAESKAEREKIKDLPKEERRNYWQNANNKRLEEVVKAGIITQEQAAQIKELWQNKRNNKQ
ncbi:hypothetical protein JCM14036_18440 [Desulfotomaculum defluvii]